MKNIQYTMIDQNRQMTRPISVSSLNLAAKDLLESNFAHIWIEGEVSNFSKPGSGHAYFSLKDKNSQINCAFFRQYQGSAPEIKNGQLIHVKAKLSIYAPRGSYQLLVFKVLDAGKGQLEKAFLELKEKLFKEGLFDEARKQPLPKYPKTIGIVTSKTSAALQDALAVLAARFPVANIEVYDCLVQGEMAAQSICKAIQYAQNKNTADVLIICRGGGSLEDLWPFNEEIVARQIVNCTIPTISGVGHEVDTTIADWVCDQRAPTPSAAAQNATPDKFELIQKLDGVSKRLTALFERQIFMKQNTLEMLNRRLIHPAEKINNLSLQFKSRLSELRHHLAKAIDNRQSRIQQIEQNLQWRINSRMERAPIPLNLLSEKLNQHMARYIYQLEDTLANLSSRLDLLSPLGTLKRGYTMTTDADGRAITRLKDVKKNQIITINWVDGKKDFQSID
jgi:exodeoxyribonuclease VII large subunit